MLRDAQARAGDRSVLGQHLAVVALDGVAELAMHLCAYELSLQPAREWLKLLKQLRDELGSKWDGAGAQGADELHRSRNLVQHAGVLPHPDQLARWAADVERFVRGLTSAALGIDLAHATSGLAIKDTELRRLIDEAEGLLLAGDAPGAFALTCNALDAARRAWSSRGGSADDPFGGPFGRSPQFDEFRQANAAFQEVYDRLDVATFTSDLGEWIWLRQQLEESRKRSPPTAEDAQRALAFVVGWILRYESYVTRYPEERWRAWRDSQRAPTTGVPGGPHITVLDVQPWRATQASGVEWTFALSDLPAPDDIFSWAVSVASGDLRSAGEAGSAYLGLRGELKVRVPPDTTETRVLAIVRNLLADAGIALRRRDERLRQEEEDIAALAAPFASALKGSALPVNAISARVADPKHPQRSPAAVSVELELDDALNRELPEALSIVANEIGLAMTSPPMAWGGTVWFAPELSPESVVRWLSLGLERARAAGEERERVAAEGEQRRIATLASMRRLLEIQEPQ
ncbi:hypothetical protein OJ997_22910 [Solirubrobacter phytolaccae]|uniref:Uncharacterized protein n=1 Tax=Solirubrobacter phytolaccae TaxID=1404360 RepID=A0A9X3NBT5_9ACTN|nr:hypothetical protein [Solirubrobacter phytolaccae]MDA0183179.1 hypothetical protein [Solirubrobacter phytolaccae]